ncbi:MAG TPA: FAD-dependent oxidoreductase [Gemmataceae bacterium]|nr:FAD-dependent oxidoreductase [Gemmataceae bacterium]
MNDPAGSVVVVGGGVIGAACAHFLRRAGWEVTVLDQGGFGSGCSHANCGLVCPSHVLPLAVPGAVRAGLKALFQSNGPLAIRPRFDPALWSWLYHFTRRCNQHDMLDSGRAIKALLDSSRSLYEQIIAEEHLDCEWETRGLLFVLETQQGMAHYAETDRLMSDEYSVSARRLDGDAVVALEPALKPGLAGGFLYERDAHLRPDRLLSSWRNALVSHGVTVREDCKVRGIVKERGRGRAVITEAGEVSADAFVFATGALTPRWAGQLGCRIPIQPGKGYSITMPRPARCPSIPLIFDEHRVAATPMRSGYRLGSTMEFAGYDASLNRHRLELLKVAARRFLHEPYGDVVEEEWCGWRPMTYDGKPIIDRSPAMSNVLIAAGHNMLGLSMAPATGKLVAELLGGQMPHVDPAPYSVKRF